MKIMKSENRKCKLTTEFENYIYSPIAGLGILFMILKKQVCQKNEKAKTAMFSQPVPLFTKEYDQIL